MYASNPVWLAGDRPAARRSEFLGLRFDQITEEDAIAEIGRLAGLSSFSYVVTPNVDHLVQLHRRPSGDRLWRSYFGAALCLCDSRIVQALASRSGIWLELVVGSDLTARLLRESCSQVRDVAVVGGDRRLLSQLAASFPHLRWHHHMPPMGVRANPEAQGAIADFVERTAADIVFFAIGAPQSELVCHQIALRKRARGVALCVGASLEFLTGAKERAPVWMQQRGLEWLFRLATEPRRLWRRYLVDGPRIFRIWFDYRPRGSHSPGGFGSSRSGET